MEKLIKVIEESFMRELLIQSDITDISYNGKALYYFSSKFGRKYYKDIKAEEVAVFLRNVANYANERFSFTDTFLDISFAKYRLSAMHNAISRHAYDKSFSFALRINHDYLRRHPNYLPREVNDVISTIIAKGKSIIISGMTGVGKTTLQKHLVTLLPSSARVLVIDNVLELGEITSLHPLLDLTLWQTKTSSEAEIKDFVQKALRFHPDYLIIAETRGSEMKEILQGAITGHPNIVTLHAESAELAYERVLYLINSSDKSALFRAYPNVIHLAKRELATGEIERFVSKITMYCPTSDTVKTLYSEEAG